MKNKTQLFKSILAVTGLLLLIWKSGFVITLGIFLLIWANNFDFEQKK